MVTSDSVGCGLSANANVHVLDVGFSVRTRDSLCSFQILMLELY